MGDNRHVVVRNTFLEFSDDKTSFSGEGDGRRVRAFSDMTDSKLPVKVELSNSAGFYQVQRHRLASTGAGGESPHGAPPPGNASSSGASAVQPGQGLSPVMEEAARPSFPIGAGLSNPYAMGPPGDLGWMPPPDGSGMPPFNPGSPVFWGGYEQPGMPPAQFPGYGGQPVWPGYGVQPPWPQNPYMGHTLPPNAGPQAGNKGSRKDRAQKNHLQLSDHLGESGGGKGKSKGKATSPQAAGPTPGAQAASTVKPGEETTVMLRNVPNGYTRLMLIELLNTQGFPGRYDFVYLPMDFRNGVNLGYAFVNLVVHKDAVEFTDKLQGFCEWSSESTKVCEVTWAHPHQGLAEHVERYRNSPVMHPSMDDEYKPMVFQNGIQQPFPAPTKAIKAPKLRLTARDGSPKDGSPQA